jgi:hypothetical protein
VRVHSTYRAVRLIVAPHDLRETIGRHDPPHVDQQSAEEAPLPRTREGDLTSVYHDPQRAENPELHTASNWA